VIFFFFFFSFCSSLYKKWEILKFLEMGNSKNLAE
jgi:hypothetical protein